MRVYTAGTIGVVVGMVIIIWGVFAFLGTAVSVVAGGHRRSAPLMDFAAANFLWLGIILVLIGWFVRMASRPAERDTAEINADQEPSAARGDDHQ